MNNYETLLVKLPNVLGKIFPGKFLFSAEFFPKSNKEEAIYQIHLRDENHNLFVQASASEQEGLDVAAFRLLEKFSKKLEELQSTKVIKLQELISIETEKLNAFGDALIQIHNLFG